MEGIDISFHAQGSAEWFEERLGKFTSSKVKCLLVTSKTPGEAFGDGAWTYLYEKLNELTTGTVEENGFKGSDATDWGIAHEPEAIEMYQYIKKLTVEACGFETYNESYGGSPDGKIHDDNNTDRGIIEVKCPYVGVNHLKFMDMETADEFKKDYKDYYCQIQSNLLVTNRIWCDFISYDPRQRLEAMQIKIIRIYRDEAFIKNLQERVELAIAVLIETLEKMLKKSIAFYNAAVEIKQLNQNA